MAFRYFLLLACTVALAHAGGKSLSPQESRQFLDLFRRYCGGGSSTQNQDGNTFYYCKFADNGPVTLQVNHDAEVNGGDTPKQVIFVQPPSYNYVHNVALRGSPGNPQQTDIYVLPPTAEHNLQLQDTRSSVQAQKPSLYFLAGDQQGSGQVGSSSGVIPSRRPGPSDGNTPLRPSAQPPNPSDPNAISGGYQQPQQTYYGAPSVNPRNQRNVAALKSSHYRTPYTTL